MNEHALSLRLDLRVWQDEQMGQRWRLAYRDGDEEMVVAFPDSAALGDFIAEQLGLNLLDTPMLPMSVEAA
ncbi:MAG: hypothetical protein HGA19_06210 [Oscillochloris sp.]|nr:hypothetical protein [Oscillochloris sp.]